MRNITLFVARDIGDKDEMNTVSTLQPPRKYWVGFAKMQKTKEIVIKRMESGYFD
jgi:hypothetical protein